MTRPEGLRLRPRYVYISGPMRGYPNYNFDAFDDVHRELKRQHPDWGIHNPALKDRYDGFNPDTDTPTQRQLIRWMRRDFIDVCTSDVIVMLDGWEASVGARREMQVAVWASLTLAWWDVDKLKIRPLNGQRVVSILDRGLEQRMV